MEKEWKTYVTKDEDEVILYAARDTNSAIYYAHKYLGGKAKAWELSYPVIRHLNELGVRTNLGFSEESGADTVELNIYKPYPDSHDRDSFTQKVLKVLGETFAQVPLKRE